MIKLLPITKADKKDQHYLTSLCQERPNYKLLKCGLIEWPDNPSSWGGAFSGKYALCRIEDHSLSHGLVSKLARTVNLLEHVKYSKFYFPSEMQNKYEKTLLCKVGVETAMRCKLTESELEKWSEEFKRRFYAKYWEAEAKRIEDFARLMEEPSVTIETPIRFYLCGNDDTSYTQVYESKRSAINALQALLSSPNWNMLIKVLRFKFTN